MATIGFLCPKIRHFSSIKRTFTAGKIIFNKTPANVSGDVPGLSPACIKIVQEPVGPGAAKTSEYKNPEYYCYDNTSYFEAEIEILKYRCPQPSVKQPYFHEKVVNTPK